MIGMRAFLKSYIFPPIKRCIRFQHLFFPLPLRIFDLAFRSNIVKRSFLNYYGGLVFEIDYHGEKRRREGNLSYWLSKESMYWHYWRQTETTASRLKFITHLVPVLKDPNLIAMELGFGIGKNRYKHPELFPFKFFIGVEPNKFCVDVASSRMPNVCLLQMTNVEALQKFSPDIVFIFGGVLMYHSRSEIEVLFQHFVKLKALVIFGEGCDTQISRADGTTMWDFQHLIKLNTDAQRSLIISRFDNGIYDYFVMH